MSHFVRRMFIFDLDGTIANIDHRRNLVEGPGKKDWNTFFALCPLDSVNGPVAEVLRSLHRIGYRIEIWSGRKGEYREATIEWLKKNHIPYDKLRMRPLNDFTRDELLKQGWFLGLSPDWKSRIVGVFDDRDRVVEMWRNNGVACFQVAKGDF